MIIEKIALHKELKGARPVCVTKTESEKNSCNFSSQR